MFNNNLTNFHKNVIIILCYINLKIVFDREKQLGYLLKLQIIVLESLSFEKVLWREKL